MSAGHEGSEVMYARPYADVAGANRYRHARLVCFADHGSVPCVVASLNSNTSPGRNATFSTNSRATSCRCISGGHGRLALCEPRTTQNPPSPGFVSVSATETARRRLYMRPFENVYAKSSHHDPSSFIFPP